MVIATMNTNSRIATHSFDLSSSPTLGDDVEPFMSVNATGTGKANQNSFNTDMTTEEMDLLVADLSSSEDDDTTPHGPSDITSQQADGIGLPQRNQSNSDDDDLNELISLFPIDTPRIPMGKRLLGRDDRYSVSEDETSLAVIQSMSVVAPSWLDATVTDATDGLSESESEGDDASVTPAACDKTASTHRSSIRLRNKQNSRKEHPQVPTRASKRLRSNGDGKWLEERAISHLVLSPYDASLDLLSVVE
jgi:hypothetical protein